VEEKAKLSVGLVKLLGRKLPSFWNMKRRLRGQLNFRDFLKGVNGQGSREAKRLSRLENACRWDSIEPKQRLGPGQIDLAAAQALHLTAQLCLGVAAAHGCDKAGHVELLDDASLVCWALRQWETRELSEDLSTKL